MMRIPGSWFTAPVLGTIGKNKTWRATGALPYSIKINDTYIPYKDTVMAIPFAVIGSFMDGHRYNGAQDDELMSQVGIVTDLHCRRNYRELVPEGHPSGSGWNQPEDVR